MPPTLHGCPPPLPAPQGRPYRAVIGDTEGAALPARGAPVEAEAEAELVLQLAQAAGEAAAGAAAGLSGAASAGSLASSASAAWLAEPSPSSRQ